MNYLEISSLKRNSPKRSETEMKSDDIKPNVIKNMKNYMIDRKNNSFYQKDEYINDIIKKNPLIKREQRLEGHLSSSVLVELKKMSERTSLREIDEVDKPKRKQVRFSNKNVAKYVGGLKMDKDEESLNRMCKILY
jgi:hypothetical protein